MAGQISRKTLLKWAPLLVLLVLVVFFTAINPAFFSLRNFARIAITSSPALMVAIGVTFIIIMGSIDLSMEGAISLNAVVFAFVFQYFGGSLCQLGLGGAAADRGFWRAVRLGQWDDPCAAAHPVVHGQSGDGLCRHRGRDSDDRRATSSRSMTICSAVC